MLSNFVLQLGRLKEIYLPDEITSHHEQRYYNEIIENISNRKPLIQIHFDKFAGTVKCRFPVNDPDEPATDRVEPLAEMNNLSDNDDDNSLDSSEQMSEDLHRPYYARVPFYGGDSDDS